MFRTALGLTVVAMLCAASGCQMGCNPYLHSGPVYSQDGCQASTGRAGSILDGGGDQTMTPAETTTPAETPAPTPAPTSARPKSARQPSYAFDDNGRSFQQSRLNGRTKPGLVPGSERVISVTEKVVKPADNSAKLADASSDEPSEQASASGWTARRPTSEMLR